MKLTLPKVGFILSILFILSCKEQDETIRQEKITPASSSIDKDMMAAIELANNYLSRTGARSESAESTITVLKYENGQLLYSTNTDDIEGYQAITEETVTATTIPEEYVFWYSGSGLEDLEGVEFDSTSQAFLGNDPSEVSEDEMWTIVMPSEFDSTQTYLKYDIIYDFEGNEGEVIRLDPKLEVNGDGSH